MKVDIIPAILPKSFEELSSGLERLRGVSPAVQIDLVGGNIIVGHSELPLWKEFDFEFDIMLPHPEREVEVCFAAGAARVVVHAAAEGAGAALQWLQETRRGDYPLAIGLALRAHDTPEVYAQHIGQCDYVQVMGIDHEGVQGSEPDPHGKDVELIRNLRALYPELFIQADGAAAAHVRALVDAGVNRLVVGSAIINAEDPHAAYKALYTEANAH